MMQAEAVPLCCPSHLAFLAAPTLQTPAWQSAQISKPGPLEKLQHQPGFSAAYTGWPAVALICSWRAIFICSSSQQHQTAASRPLQLHCKAKQQQLPSQIGSTYACISRVERAGGLQQESWLKTSPLLGVSTAALLPSTGQESV